jgi:alpha-glucuronidase
VILQVKNGPVDFQVREPVSPLLGRWKKPNQLLEVQITQEYTGQQRHICYLVPMWKEALDFDTYVKGPGSFVRRMCDGTLHSPAHAGLAAVANIGDEACWTGNPMAQANLYGYGRLCWNPELSARQIAREWVDRTLGADPEVRDVAVSMLLSSRQTYEDYTAPWALGGW